MEQRLKFLLRFCEFFGIYLSATKSEPRLTIWTLQHLHATANVFLVCAVYVWGVCTVEISSGLVLTWLVGTLVFSAQFLANVLIRVEACFNQQRHDLFLHLLNDIELNIKLRLKVDMRIAPQLKQLRQYFGWLWLLSLLSLTTNGVISTLKRNLGYFWYALWLVTTMRLRILQLFIYVQLLRHYLQCLCEKLQQLVTYKLAPNKQLLDIDYARLASLEHLCCIKDIYGMIFSAFQLLNELAGWSFFSIIACYILEGTCHLYWMLLALDHRTVRQSYIASFMILLLLALIICDLCYVCDKCKKSGQTMAVLLSKLIVHGRLKSTLKYQSVLKQFAIQVQQQRIEVTAQHFFSLDLQLLMSICAAIATYLVILIQFLET